MGEEANLASICLSCHSWEAKFIRYKYRYSTWFPKLFDNPTLLRYFMHAYVSALTRRSEAMFSHFRFIPIILAFDIAS